ncbi:MAG: zinc ABC transporter substrate-binding protein, partial [Candidatus Eremiobacterota bacterium]
TDMARQLVGEHGQVSGLMGPGVDPHLYKASASDVAMLQKADVVFYNGLHLEGKMTEVLHSMEKTGKPVVAISDQIPRDKLQFPPAFDGNADPHIWFDVPLWATTVDRMAQGLSQADPERAADYRQRAAELKGRMEKLDAWVRSEVEKIPAERRVLVTSHDAFNYFGRAYGFEVVGLQGISTVTEAGLADRARMVDFIKKRKIPAIFVESSVSRDAIQRVSQDAGCRVGGELFSDAMGAAGTPEGTYEGMIEHNVSTLVEALKP